MKDVLIRQTQTSDADEFIELRNYVWSLSYAEILPPEIHEMKKQKASADIEKLKRDLTDDNFISYVAVADSKIVASFNGFIKASAKYYADLGYAGFEILYIHPEFQGQGIGRVMLQKFCDAIKARGVTKFIINCLKENHDARRVYEKWGGKLDSREEPHPSHGDKYMCVFYLFEI